MAKEAKADAAEANITADDLRRVIKEASRQKQLASEYSGHHGQVISNAVERYGLEKTALTFARRLHDMEASKRQSVLRALIFYSDLLGFFDQIDAFDDLLPILEGIVARSKGGSKTKTPAAKPAADEPVTAALLQ